MLLFEYGVTSLLRRLNRRPPSAAYRYGGWVASAAGGLQTGVRGVLGWVGRPRRLSSWWALAVALFALVLWVERPCLPEDGAARSVDRLTSGWFSVASWVNEGPVKAGRSSPAGIQPLFCSTRQAPGHRPPTHRKAAPPKTRRRG